MPTDCTGARCYCGHPAHVGRCGAPVAWTQEFHDVALRCNCIGPPLESATPIQSPDRERDRLRGAMSAQDERNLAATRRCGIEPCGCDTPDRLADEVLALRAECARLHAALDAPTEKTP